MQISSYFSSMREFSGEKMREFVRKVWFLRNHLSLRQIIKVFRVSAQPLTSRMYKKMGEANFVQGYLLITSLHQNNGKPLVMMSLFCTWRLLFIPTVYIFWLAAAAAAACVCIAECFNLHKPAPTLLRVNQLRVTKPHSAQTFLLTMAWNWEKILH